MSAQTSDFAKIVVVGGTAGDAAAAFLDAVERAERGEAVHERVLSFQSWEGLASVMTRERYRLLRHLHAHPEPSVSALARALGRQYPGCMRTWLFWKARGCSTGTGVRCGRPRTRSRRKSGSKFRLMAAARPALSRLFLSCSWTPWFAGTVRHPSRPRSPHLITLGKAARHAATLTLACDRCGRRGRLSVARLLAEWGEHMALADIIDAITASCPQRKARGPYEQCAVHWPDLSGLFAGPGAHGRQVSE